MPTIGANDPMELLITVDEVAAMLSLSPRTVWRRSSTGELPAPVRIGGSVRWRRSDIVQWVNAGCPRAK
jgi:excisionase family DNA binding protein